MNIVFIHNGTTYRAGEWEKSKRADKYRLRTAELLKIIPEEVITLISDAGYYIIINADEKQLSFVVKKIIEVPNDANK